MVARRLEVEQIDPGMGSIFSTIASALLGVLVGTRERHPRQRLLHLLDDSSWFAPANVTTTISI